MVQYAIPYCLGLSTYSKSRWRWEGCCHQARIKYIFWSVRSEILRHKGSDKIFSTKLLFSKCFWYVLVATVWAVTQGMAGLRLYVFNVPIRFSCVLEFSKARCTVNKGTQKIVEVFLLRFPIKTTAHGGGLQRTRSCALKSAYEPKIVYL